MIGQTLLHYNILQKLGQGGMGEVYLAEDTHLKRRVALKTLPAHVRSDPDHLQRFRTEAEAAAQLSHQNIAHIYSIGETGDLLFITLEWVDGDPLTGLIPEQGIPQDTFLEWFTQFMDGLAHAHQKGICHRDLKPGNLMVSKDGMPKILDFGLAQITRPEVEPEVDSEIPTQSMATILGSVAYMSPEQADNKPVSFPSDIFSMGIVMYEALAGRRPFLGDSTFAIASGILRDEPAAITALRPDISPHLARIVNRSLQKDVRKRYQVGREALIDIKEVFDIISRPVEVVDPAAAMGMSTEDTTTESSPAAAPPTAVTAFRGLLRWPVLAVVVIVVFLLGMATTYLTSEVSDPRSTAQVRKTQIATSSSGAPINGLAISPDGTMVAYTQGNQLWIRNLTELSPRPVPETDGATQPFWSPQSDAVGYFDLDDASLKKIPARGGPITVLCPLSVPFYRGGTWNADGTIVFSQVGQGNAGLYRVSAQGGTPVAIVAPDSAAGEIEFPTPCFLPDGRSLVFIVIRDDESSEVVVRSGDTGTRTRLYYSPDEALTYAAYSPTGHVLFHGGSPRSGIRAIPFSASTLTATGESFQATPDGSFPSVSGDGTLVYRSVAGDQQLVWVDRQGTITGTLGRPQEQISTPALSPDGTRVAVTGRDQGIPDIWIHEVERSIKTRFTHEPTMDVHPSWSPAGDRLAFTSLRKPDGDIFIQAIDESGEATPLAATELGEYAPSWSRDGRYLIYHVLDPNTKRDLWYLSLAEAQPPVLFLQTPFNELLPVLSPDGRYVAYESNESGRWEVYVKPFPSGEGKWVVSVNGGVYPRWNGRGNELFYVENNTLMAVTIDTRPAFKISTPRALFVGGQVRARLYSGGIPLAWSFDVTSDGRRFVVVQDVENASAPMITVAQNWAMEFEGRK